MTKAKITQIASQMQDSELNLTAEERQALAAENPEMLDLIEQAKGFKRSIARGFLYRWREQRNESPGKSLQAFEGQNAETPHGHKENTSPQTIASSTVEPEVVKGQSLPLAAYPTDLTRCNPFYPVNPKSLKIVPFLEDKILVSGEWGEICYTGPLLTVFDEDVLIGVLTLIKNNKNIRKAYVLEGIILNNQENKKRLEVLDKTLDIKNIQENMRECYETTYAYQGKIFELLKILYPYRRPTIRDYKKCLKSLKRLSVAGMEIKIIVGRKIMKNGGVRCLRKRHMASILSGFSIDEDTKDAIIIVHPLFYKTYVEKRTTYLDINTRINLNSSVSKALYRFVISQSSINFSCHYMKIAQAINMNMEQAPRQLRRLLKESLQELIEQRVLTPASGFDGHDIIRWTRVQQRSKSSCGDDSSKL